MRDIESEIRSRVEAFVEELTALVRQSALEAVADALGAEPSRGALVLKRAGRGRRGVAKGAKGRSVAARKPGSKRSSEEIASTTGALLLQIQAQPGSRIEEIARALSTSTKDLTLPVKKLLLEKKITSKGTRRATKYFPR